jgi:hypothetical protein
LAWIELHDTLGSHRKTYALADALDIPQYAAVGILGLLWTWALNSAQDGDLSKFPPHAIARAAFWQKKPELLTEALIECGWLDADMRLHDWETYAGRLIDKREEEKRRVAAYRTGKKRVPYTYSTRTVQDQKHVSEPVQYASTVPNSTIPNSTVPLQEGKIDTRAGESDVFGLTQEEATRLRDDQESIFSEAKRCGLPTTQQGMDAAMALYDAHGLDKLLEAIRKTGEQPKEKWRWPYVRGILEGNGKPPAQGTSNPFAKMVGGAL